MPDFIPRRDAQAVGWSANFTQQIVSDYQTFGFSQQDADELAALQMQFAASVAEAYAPSTRTTVAVRGKSACRAAFEQKARWMAQCIRADSKISRATRIKLGIVIGPGRDARRRRIGPPDHAPRVWILDVDGSRVTIKLKNSDWPSMNGIGPDLHGARVYAHVGEQPPTVPGEWSYIRGTSTARLTVDLASNHAPGVKVWLAAQWVNPRAQAGPVSQPVFTYLGDQSGRPGQEVA